MSHSQFVLEPCACCLPPGFRAGFGRRGVLGLAAGLASAVALGRGARAADGTAYDSMVLTCIDPRFQEPVTKHTAARKLTGKYSQFTIAGASIGVVAPAFKDWHKTFWDNLGASIQLHSIDKVIVINHRDCGAAKIAYGDAAVANAAAETKTHREAAAEFRKQLAVRHPKLVVDTGLMSLDGKVETLA